MPEGQEVKKPKGQLELFPRPAHQFQTLAELDAMGVELCATAKELHDACPADPRATRALFNALVLFGTVGVLQRRGWKWDSSPYAKEST